MTSLPEALPFIFPDPIHNAYAICVGLQSRNPPRPNSRYSSLVCARLLGYMIREAPTDEGRLSFSNEILSCGGRDQKLFELAEFYIKYFVRFFKAEKGRTPAPSVHPSRGSFDDTRDMMNLVLKEAPQDHRTAKKHALVRDGYRCVLTGNYDVECVQEMESVERECIDSGGDVNSTVAAHILGESTNAQISGPLEEHDLLGNEKRQYAATAWAVLQRFGGIDIDELNGVGIHRLQNVLTLDTAKHTMFDSLLIWFEPTDTVNRYRINGIKPIIISKLPDHVTFSSTRPDLLPLPSPRYLGIHAACAKVAHLSGAGQCIDSLIRDLEKRCVLAADGTSADVLSYALSTISVR